MTSISSTCIKLYSELRTWITSRATCEGLGGDLVRILNENMSGFIYDQLSPYRGYYWFGLNDLNAEGTVVWLDEENEVKEGPVNNESYNGNDYDCGKISFHGGTKSTWIFDNCLEKKRYICEIPQVTCPDGWVAIQQSRTCIKLFHESETWLRARATCKSIGADLVNIVNADMNHFISESSDSAAIYWIGADGFETKGHFNGAHYDDKHSDQVKSRQGRTRLHQDALCLVLNNTASAVIHNGTKCSDHNSFICEMSTIGAVPTMIPLRLQLSTYVWFNQCTVAGEGQITIEYEVFGANFTYPFRGDRGPRFQFSNTTAADVEDVCTGFDPDTDECNIFSDNCSCVETQTPGTYRLKYTITAKTRLSGKSVRLVWPGESKPLFSQSFTLPEIKENCSFCPNGWLGYINVCITLYLERRTWPRARDMCNYAGADLVKYPNDNMAHFMRAHLYLNTERPYWFRLSDQKLEGMFEQLDGDQKIAPPYWAGYETSNDKSKHCGKISWSQDMLLQREAGNCYEKNSFVCEKLPVTCPDGWIVSIHTRTCLKLYREPKTWHGARVACKSIGTDLVKFDGSSMIRLIFGLVSPDSRAVYWAAKVGWHFSRTERKFQVAYHFDTINSKSNIIQISLVPSIQLGIFRSIKPWKRKSLYPSEIQYSKSLNFF